MFPRLAFCIFPLGLFILGSSPALSEGKEGDRLIAVTDQYVLGSFTRSAVMMIVTGRTGGSGSAEKDLVKDLPASFFVEEQSVPAWRWRGYPSQVHRILYRSRSKTYIAGWTEAKLENGRSEFYDGQLTNVPWGFDIKTQNFWFDATPAHLPPLPVEFGTRTWFGLKVCVPLELARFQIEDVRAILEARSAVLVGPRESADVVLLPDEVDFIYTRNKEAEALMQRGASVVWERNFPQPPPPKPE